MGEVKPAHFPGLPAVRSGPPGPEVLVEVGGHAWELADLCRLWLGAGGERGEADGSVSLGAASPGAEGERNPAATRKTSWEHPAVEGTETLQGPCLVEFHFSTFSRNFLLWEGRTLSAQLDPRGSVKL